MNRIKKKQDVYQGFEQGPIRPPSESRSLLIRVTRNCPWNRCRFCPVYKRSRFSLRSVDNVIRDVDMLHYCLNMIREEAGENGVPDILRLKRRLKDSPDTIDPTAFHAALNWYYAGMESIFIQDANSLILKPDDLVYILGYIKERFPMAQRVTSYARSHTIVRIKLHDMERIAGAGLNRIHIGLETGSDRVLALVKKGCTKADHVKAGQRVKAVGISLSEYVMPGLGGVALSREHALETADALNLINPDFIRLRTLSIRGGIPMEKDYLEGSFVKPSDVMMAEEIKLMIENLDGITSYIKSDHILNLLETVEGKMPGDKAKIISTISAFLELPARKKMVYQVGRRTGLFRGVEDMADSALLRRAEETCRLYGVTPETVDAAIDEMMRGFV